MTRTWTNGGPPFLNAANLNALEADITTALGVPDTALAGRITDPASATQTALNATYAPVANAALTGSPTLNGVKLATTDDAFINSIIFGG